jgi:hypothetical protein
MWKQEEAESKVDGRASKLRKGEEGLEGRSQIDA